MSTGPGPTRKDDESHDASVDDVADLLVEELSHPVSLQAEKPLDDGLDVMLETPGPVLANTFMPPPPAPVGLVGEEGDSVEEAGAATNLAYEDLLAKLVLPAKVPEPEATMPVPDPANPLPLPEAFGESVDEPVFPAATRPSSPSFQIAPPTEDRTLVTENPLVAEEQQAAAREGRATVTREQPRVIQEELQAALTEPGRAVNGAVKSKVLYLMFGGLLVLGGMVLGALVLKLLGAGPAPQPPAVGAPAPVPQPTPAPPAQVQPLPPTPAVAVPSPSPPAPTEVRAVPAAEGEAPSAAEAEKSAAHARKREGHKAAHVAAAPKPAAPAPAPKAAAPAPKAATPAPAAKPAKKSKGSSYVDPFDN